MTKSDMVKLSRADLLHVVERLDATLTHLKRRADNAERDLAILAQGIARIEEFLVLDERTEIGQ